MVRLISPLMQAITIVVLLRNPAYNYIMNFQVRGLEDEYGLPFTVESNLSPAMKQIEVQEAIWVPLMPI